MTKTHTQYTALSTHNRFSVQYLHSPCCAHIHSTEGTPSARRDPSCSPARAGTTTTVTVNRTSPARCSSCAAYTHRPDILCVIFKTLSSYRVLGTARMKRTLVLHQHTHASLISTIDCLPCYFWNQRPVQLHLRKSCDKCHKILLTNPYVTIFTKWTAIPHQVDHFVNILTAYCSLTSCFIPGRTTLMHIRQAFDKTASYSRHTC